MSAEDRRAYSAPALEKGLDVLEWLSAAVEPQSTREIADALERSRSEIFRMLNVLEARGYIARPPGGEGFVLTSRLLELAMRRAPTRNLLGAALPEMEQLAQDVRQSCHLAVRSGDDMVVIARVESPDDLGFAVRIGYRRSLAGSTSGRVLLAFGARELPRASLAALARAAEGSTDELRDDLARVRRQGFRRARSTAVSGIIDLGVPIFDGDTGIAALTIPCVQKRNEHHAIADVVEALKAAGARVTSALALASGAAA